MGLVYQVPFWDSYQWDKFVNADSEVAKTVTFGEEKIYSFPDFATEVFSRLYSGDLDKIEKIKPESEWAVNLHESLDKNTDFQSLVELVTGQSYVSGLAAASFLSELAAKMPEPKSELTDPQELRSQVLGVAATSRLLYDFKSLVGGQKQRGNQSDQSVVNMLVEEGKKAVAGSQEYADQVMNSLGFLPDLEISACAEKASKETQEFIDSVEGFGWGLGMGVDGVGGSLEEKIELAKKVLSVPKLQKIAKIAGRLKRIAAKKQLTKTKHALHTIVSVETGNNLARLLPSQALMLKLPVMRPLFVKGYAEKSLLQYQMGGKERMGRGPIVACLDSSRSMGGKLEIWSKAVCLALLGIAIAQKRHFRVIHFSNGVARTDDFPASCEQNAKTQARLLASMEYFSGGGTNWTKPLDKAVDCIKSDKYLKDADIILITDGNCDVDDSWLEQFKTQKSEWGFTVFGVGIGFMSEPLQKVSDQTVKIGDIDKADGQIAEVFGI